MSDLGLGLGSGTLGAELQKVMGGEKRRAGVELLSANTKKNKSFGYASEIGECASSIKSESLNSSPSSKLANASSSGNNAGDSTLKEESMAYNKSINSEIKKVNPQLTNIHDKFSDPIFFLCAKHHNNKNGPMSVRVIYKVGQT
jgi:hypothetical protein